MIPAATGATASHMEWRILPLPLEAENILVEGMEEELRGKSLAEVTQWRHEKLSILKNAPYE